MQRQLWRGIPAFRHPAAAAVICFMPSVPDTHCSHRLPTSLTAWSACDKIRRLAVCNSLNKMLPSIMPFVMAAYSFSYDSLLKAVMALLSGSNCSKAF
jgi:hypothetical protein